MSLLCSTSLGEVLMDVWYCPNNAPTDNWRKRMSFWILSAIPQIVGTAFVSNLCIIANYMGIFTILSYLICPSLMSVYSQKVLRVLPDVTPQQFAVDFNLI